MWIDFQDTGAILGQFIFSFLSRIPSNLYNLLLLVQVNTDRWLTRQTQNCKWAYNVAMDSSQRQLNKNIHSVL